MATIRRHPIGTFLVATYALAALTFALPLLADIGLGVLPIELPGVAPFLLVSTVSLAVVAFAVTAAVEGRSGVHELRARVLRFRVSPRWYAGALLVLPLAALAVSVVFDGAAPLERLAREPGVAVSWLAEIAVAVVLINFWEEIAWTGFVLDRLQPRLGPLRATIATAWAQAAFHLPLLFIVGGVSDVRIDAGQYPFYLVALFAFPLGNRTLLTWLYNSSGRSLPVAGLTHSSWGLATGSAFLPVLVPGFEGTWAYAGFAVVALVLIVATRGRLGYVAHHRPRRAVRSRAFATPEVSAQ